jgi:hypothetical protein
VRQGQVAHRPILSAGDGVEAAERRDHNP